MIHKTNIKNQYSYHEGSIHYQNETSSMMKWENVTSDASIPVICEYVSLLNLGKKDFGSKD